MVSATIDVVHIFWCFTWIPNMGPEWLKMTYSDVPSPSSPSTTIFLFILRYTSCLLNRQATCAETAYLSEISVRKHRHRWSSIQAVLDLYLNGTPTVLKQPPNRSHPNIPQTAPTQCPLSTGFWATPHSASALAQLCCYQWLLGPRAMVRKLLMARERLSRQMFQ